MPKEILNDIIHHFSPEEFIHFFRLKNHAFRPYTEPAPEYNDEQFTNALFIGEIPFSATDRLVIYSFKVNRDLTERSGKKAQYEKGKTILKDSLSDAGIFIFYDQSGRFRFSLITAIYTGTKRQFSHYKRYTYFVSPELTNKTFLRQIGEADFTSIEDIKEAFSVEPVTKQFYNELQNWYFWAMDKIRFLEDYRYSNDPEKDREIRNATSLIRLITRIIFIWFLKEKGLIPPKLFSESEMKSIVKDFMKGKNSSNYYNAILQNLFFATLNQKMTERRFASEEGYPSNKKEYGVKTLFRYADMFLISKDEALSLFKDIPFLNGGLFDCLDKEDEEGKVIYIDGFSRNPRKRAVIPDYLFFQKEEQRVDLSEYGLGTNKTFRGLIEILNSYNFTIDENTPVDQEVALDPELLGKVFENLLASYNPETATTARKATGSYYTPREIVDYMVDESICEYLKTSLPDIDEERIRLLLSYSEETPEFTEDEKQGIISAIDRSKILDPACGSGAFPMGVLHKLVHVLQKLDPDNRNWYELQYQKALRASEEVFRKDDRTEREEMLKEINEAFDESINYPDFARKLYLIENCIYGVDIQPIAIQIAKLRFFISLVLDQKVDRTKENLGIRALPNLETKFVSANTLVELDRPEQMTLVSDDIRKLEQKIQDLRHRYFQAKTRTEKQRLQKKDRKLRQTLAEKLESLGFSHDTAEKIAHFDLFDQNASADWFDPEWMFGVTDGFDIVIGNPPYVRQEKIKRLKPTLQKQSRIYTSTADLYTYFYEKGYEFLRLEGILCFISSNKWMRARYGENLRRFLKENTKVLTLIDFGGYPVFEQTVDTNIIVLKKEKPKERHRLKFVNVKGGNINDITSYIKNHQNSLSQKSLSESAWTLADEKVLALKEKIENIGTPLKDWDVKIYRGVLTGFNEAFIIDNETKERLCKEDPKSAEILKPILRGRDIGRYYYRWAGLWVIKIESGWTNKNRGKMDPENFFKCKYPAIYKHLMSFANQKAKGRRKGLFDRDDYGDYWWELRDCSYYPKFEKEKIVWQRVTKQFSFTLVPDGIYILDSMAFMIADNSTKYVLSILNSRLIDFYVKTYVHQYADTGFLLANQYVERIPIPKIPESDQNPFIDLVDKILSLTQSPDYPDDPQKKVREYERQIDQMVYQLYGLTEEEIRIVEGEDKNTLS